MQENSCLGTGFVTLDIIQSDVSSKIAKRYAGGSCANVLTILSFLGWESTIFSRIGNDLSGIEVLIDLNNWNVNTNLLIIENNKRTPIIFQNNFYSHDIPQHHFSRNCPICGIKSAGYRPLLKKNINDMLKMIPETSSFYFDRVSQTNHDLSISAKKNGSLIVFEPSGIKDQNLFLSCLRNCHIFKHSHGVLPVIKDLVIESGVPIEIETFGSKGLQITLRYKSKVIHNEYLPSLQAPFLKDASGSGDWCSAGLIYAFLKDKKEVPNIYTTFDNFLESVKFGQALAALNCSFDGARGLMYAFPMKKVTSLANKLLKGEAVSTDITKHPFKSIEIPSILGQCDLCGSRIINQ